MLMLRYFADAMLRTVRAGADTPRLVRFAASAAMLLILPLSAPAQTASAPASEMPSAADVCSSIPGTTTLLPCGYLSTAGSQIVDQQGRPVRLVCIGWNGLNSLGGAPDGWNTIPLQQHLLEMVTIGFNCIRLSWTDAGMQNALGYIRQIVDVARPLGIKVVLDHHNNEGISGDASGWACTAQQVNGLWFDSGPGTDGTNGCNNPGTVTAQKFQQDWVAVAQAFAGDPTVIGFDLDNEPQANSNSNLNWGKGGPTDIWAMYTSTGNAILAVNPGALIICEGPSVWYSDPQNYGFTVSGETGNLTGVLSKPVMLNVPNKVVYSVHEYPTEVSGNPNDTAPGYLATMNQFWGFVVTQNIAPVFVGEIGSSMSNANDQAWAQMIVAYLNGTAPGGLTLQPGGQGVSIGWFLWGCEDGQIPDGVLQNDWSTARPEQMSVVSQLLQQPVHGGGFDTAAYAAALNQAAQAVWPSVDTTNNPLPPAGADTAVVATREAVTTASLPPQQQPASSSDAPAPVAPLAPAAEIAADLGDIKTALQTVTQQNPTLVPPLSGVDQLLDAIELNTEYRPTRRRHGRP